MHSPIPPIEMTGWAEAKPDLPSPTAAKPCGLYVRVERDDLLSPLFPGGVSAAHREHVTTMCGGGSE
jgi:hypothetical protein